MNEQLRKLVWGRAAGACEYCRVPQAWDPLPFGIDHIRPQFHHGITAAENICLCCFQCNTFKGSNVAGYDPETEQLSRIFHPRRDTWHDHFEFRGATIRGKTVCGRTTADVLRMNIADRLEHRRLLLALGVLDISGQTAP